MVEIENCLINLRPFCEHYISRDTEKFIVQNSICFLKNVISLSVLGKMLTLRDILTFKSGKNTNWKKIIHTMLL